MICFAFSLRAFSLSNKYILPARLGVPVRQQTIAGQSWKPSYVCYDFCLALGQRQGHGADGWPPATWLTPIGMVQEAVSKLQPTKGGKLRSSLIQRDRGLTARVAIFDAGSGNPQNRPVRRGSQQQQPTPMVYLP